MPAQGSNLTLVEPIAQCQILVSSVPLVGVREAPGHQPGSGCCDPILQYARVWCVPMPGCHARMVPVECACMEHLVV